MPVCGDIDDGLILEQVGGQGSQLSRRELRQRRILGDENDRIASRLAINSGYSTVDRDLASLLTGRDAPRGDCTQYQGSQPA